ncbi:5'-3' exoribonuclease 2 [Umbelopsis sp. WA50703]
MGVPALFRWLSNKFPKIVTPCVEEQPKKVNGVEVPIDPTKPNPNGEEFDNLYLDMNAIIHPCCHPENKPAPETEDEMMIDIFEYIDRIVTMIRPRSLLYMAIDGVAPRAKMNQQRSRRFRASQLAQAEQEAKEKVQQELIAIGQLHQLPVKKKAFDSNCITPGTPFMDNLATCLRYHIAHKQNTDPAWKDLKVILSDASVAGEGEHKMMEYIRQQRARPEHNPNTVHVMYGLDADLIMLALATHEAHFKILREDVFAKEASSKNCFVCGKPGHRAAECRNQVSASNEPAEPTKDDKAAAPKPYVLMHVEILREYLEYALKPENPDVVWDLEHAIDDWVFLCFFVGNDFLPHLPSLEIREGAIDTLCTIWKKCLPVMGGYMTSKGEVDLSKVQFLVTELGKMEDQIFMDRKMREERRSQGAKRRKLENERRKVEREQYDNGPTFGDNTAVPVFAPSEGMSNHDVVANRASLRMANQSAAAALKAEIMGTAQDGETADEPGPHGTKRKADELDEAEAEADQEDANDESDEPDNEAAGRAILARVAAEKKAKDDAAQAREPDDEVRFWEAGWKGRFYKSKFGIAENDSEEKQKIVKAYCEGLCWVFKYYCEGCVSWSWYYPYYYAPMASDFVDLDQMKIEFELNAPLRPFEQLMGVLPAASRDHIPKAFHHLMTDEFSPIIDFYPVDFDVDMDGKKWEWQGVVKLPFIDKNRLLEAMDTVYDQLTEEEQMRNTLGPDKLFVADTNKLYDFISTVYTKRGSQEPIPLDPSKSDGITGFINNDPDCIPRSTLRSPLPDHDLPDIANDRSLSVIYTTPNPGARLPFKPALLKGARLGQKRLNWEDLQRATFEKQEHRPRGDRWDPQGQHLAQHREFHSRSGGNRNNGYYQGNDGYGGGYGGGGGGGGRGGGYSGGYGGGYNQQSHQGYQDRQPGYGGYQGGGYGGPRGNDGYGGGHHGNNYGGNFNSNRGYRGGGGYQGQHGQQNYNSRPRGRGGYQNNGGYQGGQSHGGYRGGGRGGGGYNSYNQRY